MRILAAAIAVFFLAGNAASAETITNPDWVKKPRPEELMATWPAKAGRKGMSGKATISCQVNAQGLLEQCKVESESPAGEGFGAAALLLAPSFKMKPKTVDGRPVGGAMITIPINYNATGPISMGPPRSALLNPVWLKAPSFADVDAAWPKTAGDITAGGATLRCDVFRDGSLTDCEIFNELPARKGFGRAAKTLADGFQMRIDPEAAKQIRDGFVNVSFKFINPATPEGQARRISKPRWITTLDPDKIVAIFPKEAADAKVLAGKGVADCQVKADGRLIDCKVGLEEPAALGFGASAVAVAGIMQMNPWTEEGRPVDGARVRLPITFKLAPEDLPQPK